MKTPGLGALMVALSCLVGTTAVGSLNEVRLDLLDALGAGKHLEIYVRHRGDYVGTAFGRAPRFNRMPYSVGIAGFQANDGAYALRAAIRIPSDGRIPRGGAALQGTLAVGPQSDGSLTYRLSLGDSRRSGSVRLTRLDSVDLREPATLRLRCETLPDRAPARRLVFEVPLVRGTAVGARARPTGTLTDTHTVVRVEQHALTIAGAKVYGSLKTVQRALDGPAETVSWEIDGQRVGRSVIGTLVARKEGGQILGAGSFSGDLTKAAEPGPGSVLHATLYDALPGGHYIDLYMNARTGGFATGFATTPTDAHTTHPLDLTQLTMNADGTLAGSLGLSLGADDTAATRRYVLQGALKDGWLTGRFTCDADDESARGDIEGIRFAATQPRDLTRLTVYMTDALTADPKAKPGTRIGLIFQDGAFSSGSLQGSDRRSGGVVDGATVRIDGTTLSGQISVTTTEGGVRSGAYTFDIDADLVGSYGAGAFRASREGGGVQNGRHWLFVQFADE